jgi:hypothetical protein
MYGHADRLQYMTKLIDVFFKHSDVKARNVRTPAGNQILFIQFTPFQLICVLAAFLYDMRKAVKKSFIKNVFC